MRARPFETKRQVAAGRQLSGGRRGLCVSHSQTAQINQRLSFEQFLGRNRQGAARRVTASEQRSDAVRHRPDMQSHHQRRRTVARRHLRAKLFGSGAQHRKGAVASVAQFGIVGERNSAPRTWPNNRRARCARNRDKPGLADRAQRTHPAAPRPRRAPTPLRIDGSHAAPRSPEAHHDRGNADKERRD